MMLLKESEVYNKKIMQLIYPIKGKGSVKSIVIGLIILNYYILLQYDKKFIYKINTDS